MAIVNPTGRTLHDLIAGTVVIREYGSSTTQRVARVPRSNANC